VNQYDLQLATKFFSALFGEEKFKIELLSSDLDVSSVEIDSFSIFKVERDGEEVFRIGVTTYHAGTYWDPPDQDFEEMDGSWNTFMQALSVVATKLFEQKMNDVWEGLFYEEEQNQEETQELVES